jgi:hypothetical protein
MPAAALIGLSAFALMSGPICGGIHWHHWNRDKARELWVRRAREERSSEKTESAAA